MREEATIAGPGRPAASQERNARDLLLTAAAELFSEQGVAATTFAMIAKRAGLTPAMLHYYFRDRDELLDLVVEERIARVIAHVWEPVEAGPNASDLIRGIVERLLDGIEQMPWIPSTWMREILNEGGLLRDRVLCRLPFEKVRMVAKAVARGQSRQGLNPELDPLLTVFSTLGLVMLHMATVSFWAETFHRKPLSRQAMRRHITGLLLDGLQHGGHRAARKRTGTKK
ncbi:MAG: TetR/AcrR family transcriptional regulator [Candidatus Korobacteraceae bacterium]